MIASGVSSTIISTPVAASIARMFLPSRPIILPLSSSESRLKIETQFSMVCSVAVRWIVSITIFLACLVADSLASSTISLICAEALVRASFVRVSINCSLASSAVRFDIFSRMVTFCSLNLSISRRLRFRFSICTESFSLS